MDKDHLIDLISNSLPYDSKDSESTKNLNDFKNWASNSVMICCNYEFMSISLDFAINGIQLPFIGQICSVRIIPLLVLICSL